jgi:hypothetical protein
VVAAEQEDGVVSPRAHHHGGHQHERLRPKAEYSVVTQERDELLRHHQRDPDHQNRQDHRDDVAVHQDQNDEHDQDGGRLDYVLVAHADLVEVVERCGRADHVCL